MAGLAAAWELTTREGGEPADVTVYEPGHLGGKLLTTEFCGHMVDEGPDSMLTRLPYAVDLCRELGLGDELVAPAAGRALLYVAGRARPLPEGLVLGVPARLAPLARSGLLSPAGMARALLDFVRPQPRLGDDVGVFELVSSRFGGQVADRLVEPLLGSIHAGTTRGLSAAATAPQLIAASRSHRSLLLGLRHVAQAAHSARPAPSEHSARPAQTAHPASPPPAGAAGAPATPRLPLFMAPAGGMQSITDALVRELARRGVRFETTEVLTLSQDGGTLVVEPDGERYDGVVSAVPAPRAARLLEAVAEPAALDVLRSVSFASVAVVTMAVPSASVPVDASLSGILVGPGERLLMTACSFGSHKWPHWSDEGTELLRLSVGKAGDERWAAMTDQALVERLCAEMGRALGGRRPLPALQPRAFRVSRWPGAFPQFKVGHLQRVASARASLARSAPRLALAGASYDGAGVPACVGSGRRAASSVWEAAHAGATA